MVHLLKKPRWSPYLVGAGIGILSWITFALMGTALGTSTSFVRVAGAIEGTFARDHVEGNEYFARTIVSTEDVARPIVDWQVALVVMLFVGALTASKLSGSTFTEHVPKLWQWRFGASRPLRYAAAFIGGVILLFGARMAGGCTSGHAISGGLQFAVSSWLFIAAMFASGIAMAFLMFGKEGRNHV